MPQVTMRVIKPNRLDIEMALLMMADGVQAEGEAEQREYEKTTQTWNNKPEHELLFEQTKAEIKATNLTDDKIYYFLHDGTRVRYATLSRDWKSKTTPGLLRSGSGRGRVLFISKKHPRPGIVARKWTDVIIRDRKRPFQANMQRILDRISKKANARGQA